MERTATTEKHGADSSCTRSRKLCLLPRMKDKVATGRCFVHHPGTQDSLRSLPQNGPFRALLFAGTTLKSISLLDARFWYKVWVSN